MSETLTSFARSSAVSSVEDSTSQSSLPVRRCLSHHYTQVAAKCVWQRQDEPRYRGFETPLGFLLCRHRRQLEHRLERYLEHCLQAVWFWSGPSTVRRHAHGPLEDTASHTSHDFRDLCRDGRRLPGYARRPRTLAPGAGLQSKLLLAG